MGVRWPIRSICSIICGFCVSTNGPLFLFTAAITGLAGYYAYTATPIYSSTSTLLIEQQNVSVMSVEELYGVDTENADYYQTQYEILKSRSLAIKVIDSLDMWRDGELYSAPGESGSQGIAGITALVSGSASNDEVASFQRYGQCVGDSKW